MTQSEDRPKRWSPWVALAAAVLIAIAWVVGSEEAGMDAFGFGFGLFLAALAWDGLRRGVIDAKMPYDREEHPGFYGFFVVFYALAALFMFATVLFL